MNEWISVKDRLPKDNGRIQMFLVCRAQKSASNGDVKIETEYFTNMFNGRQNITHWMPLPTPPPHQNTKIMTEEMKQNIITFFTNNSDRFGRFCVKLLEGHPIYWGDYKLTDQETAEIYRTMREIFPGRKNG